MLKEPQNNFLLLSDLNIPAGQQIIEEFVDLLQYTLEKSGGAEAGFDINVFTTTCAKSDNITDIKVCFIKNNQVIPVFSVGNSINEIYKLMDIEKLTDNLQTFFVALLQQDNFVSTR